MTTKGFWKKIVLKKSSTEAWLNRLVDLDKRAAMSNYHTCILDKGARLYNLILADGSSSDVSSKRVKPF